MKKILSSALAVIMMLVAVPISSSAVSAELGLVFSADSELKNTIDVSVYVKSSEEVTENGAYAYFTFNSDKLTPVDSKGNSIGAESLSDGVTFSANGLDVLTCTEGWSDESSFIKYANNANIVGMEISPSKKTDVSKGVKIGFIRLTLKSGDFSTFDENWITPIREKTDNLAFPCAVYLASGKTEPTLFAEYEKELLQLTCTHEWGELISVPPLSGKDGSAYYTCTKCGLRTSVNFSPSGQLSPCKRKSERSADLLENNVSVLPSAKANVFAIKSSDGTTIYDYSLRGAAIRCSQEVSGKSYIRFTASVDLPRIPDNVDVTQKESFKILDFGVVYCLSSSLLRDSGDEADENLSKLDVTKLVMDGMEGSVGENAYGINCAVCSYKQVQNSGAAFNYSTYDAEGKYTGSSAYSTQKMDTAEHLTFNLVVGTEGKNYKRFYAVRSFITYEYLGSQYTIYDCDNQSEPVCSSRSVFLVAERAYKNPSELPTNKEFLYKTILSLYS